MAGVIAILLALQVEAPVSAPLPAGIDPERTWKLVRVADGRELPVQVRAGRAFWIDVVDGREKRAYRLEAADPASSPAVECAVVEGAHLTLRFEGKDILRYNTGRVRPPPGVDPVYAFSGYIHPLWTPSGRTITNDFSPGNEHQHGIWFAWRKAAVEGRDVNPWAPLEEAGRLEFITLDETFSGPVFGGFRARQRLIDPDGRPVLVDAWTVKAFAARQARVFDLETEQTCAGESPLTVLKHHYGGLGVRGPAEWDGEEGVAFLTSEGRSRRDGNGTAARWVVMNGKIGGKEAGLGLLCHPTSFRAPQPTRLHPQGPFFCWVPGADDPFEIAPGRPFVSRYRFVAADRPLTAEEMNLHWDAYAEPGRRVLLSLR